MLADLDEQGFALAPGKLDAAAVSELEAVFATLPFTQPGVRINPSKIIALRAVAATVEAAETRLGAAARVVRSLLFDKRDGTNWSLGWHQDRTIEVAARFDVPGFGPFTLKQGRLHVAPPIEITASMLTVRIHVDPVDADNGPLIVAPGSHLLGYVPETAIGDVIARCGEATCLAEAGNVWFYATPILHRSDRSRAGRRRRVLQLDLSADDLPGGLQWTCDAEQTVEGRAPLA